MATKQNAAADQLMQTLLDPKADVKYLKMRLLDLCMDDSPSSVKLIDELRTRIIQNGTKGEYAAKTQRLDELIQLLGEGPRRIGTYIGRFPESGPMGQQVEVQLENGDTAFPALADRGLVKSLRCGDPVVLDAQVRTILDRLPNNCLTGEIAELNRHLDPQRVDVTLYGHTKEVYRVSSRLREQIEAGEVAEGDELLVCPKRRMAFEALPRASGHSSLRFLETAPLPDVVAQRDIGCPPPYIQDLVEHVRSEMVEPELGRKYGIRRMQTRLLKGVTGSGKTFSILATIRGIYEVMSEVTGAPIDQLPQRVLRLRSVNYLSKWLGDSDKLLDRFFDESVQLANTSFAWKGRQWQLPVICRCEEIDSLARARNSTEEVYGRIQTTALERLDHLAAEMGNLLVIFLFTTNTPELCDTAFLRRAGGEIVDFGRIGRAQFHSILAKRIRGLPFVARLGSDASVAERKVCRQVTNWMFSANGHDPGQVEVTLAGSGSPLIKYRRDMLTGAVVDQSVQQACKLAKQQEAEGTPTPGLTTEMIQAALDSQIQRIREQVTKYNARDYLTLPDGAAVATVRRIEQPSVPDYHLTATTEGR